MNNYENLFEDVKIQTKVCGICQEKKPIGCFGFDGGANYRRYECKDCAKKQSKIVAGIKKISSTPTARSPVRSLRKNT